MFPHHKSKPTNPPLVAELVFPPFEEVAELRWPGKYEISDVFDDRLLFLLGVRGKELLQSRLALPTYQQPEMDHDRGNGGVVNGRSGIRSINGSSGRSSFTFAVEVGSCVKPEEFFV